jgi:hypothetical protein
MLRTMISDEPFGQRWVLQGRLCGQWAADLKEKWETMKSMREGRGCRVDLEGVTSVDDEGERVLLKMLSEGALLVASRAYMKYVLESLEANKV